MNDIRKIKQLQSQLNKLVIDSDAIKNEISIKSRELNQKTIEVNRLKNEIKLLNNDKKIKVSEHAILRYLERTKGLNIEEIENEIVSEQIINLVDKLGGSGVFPNDKGFSLKMKDFTITTIIT